MYGCYDNDRIHALARGVLIQCLDLSLSSTDVVIDMDLVVLQLYLFSFLVACYVVCCFYVLWFTISYLSICLIL
jgi:hypothetical protein